MNSQKVFPDEKWTDEDWRTLLDDLIRKKIVTWKGLTTLILGHLNPSQVGTSMASARALNGGMEKAKLCK